MNEKYLKPAKFINSDSPAVKTYAEETVEGVIGKKKQSIALYKRIRDEFRYNPYIIYFDDDNLKSSAILSRDFGHCISKASLMVACARNLNIPARLGFANVRNHIGVDKIVEKFGTDVLAFHGYADIYLDGQWVKATPAFNVELCEKYGVEPLEFNGEEDSVFQEYDHNGNIFMEYLEDHGTFHDLPKEKMFAEFSKYYSKIVEHSNSSSDSGFVDVTKI